MYCYQSLRAGHDVNGNPRRLWVIVRVGGESADYVGVYDEGYAGLNALPDEWRERVRRGMGQLPDLEITPAQYRQLKKGDF